MFSKLKKLFERSSLNPWGSWRILEKNFVRILMRIFVISFEDLYQILEDLNKRFCLQRSLRILLLKDLWQVFDNPWRSSKILWGFSPGTKRDSLLLKTMQCKSNFEILELWFISLWKRKERTKNNFREFFWQFRLPLSRGAFFPQIFSEQSDHIVHLTYDNIIYLCIYLSNLTNLSKFWTFYSTP